MAEAASRRTRSSPATSRRASGASRCSRSSSPSARSSRGPSRRSARSRRRRTRTRATARTGSRCCATGSTPSEVVERLTARRRGPRRAPARRRRRQGSAATLHRRRSASTGPATAPGRLRGAGQHPRLRGDGGRARRDVRGDCGPAARRAADRLPRGGAGRRRRPPRPAVGVAARRRSATAATRRCPTSLVDLRVDDHERPIEELRRIYALHDALFGQTPREEWLPVEGELARGGRRAARALGYDCARRLGRRREPRGTRRRRRRDRPGRPRRAARSVGVSDGYEILELDEVETAQHRGSNLVPVRHALGFRPAGVERVEGR